LGVNALSIADPGHAASANVSFETDVAITIISGPATGSFVPCLSVTETSSVAGMGNGASDSANLGGFGVSTPFQGEFSNCNNQTVGGDPYTLGVTQILPLSMFASATSEGEFGPAQATGAAQFSTLLVFDSGGNRVPNAVFTAAEVPEPTPGVLVFCGAALFMRRTPWLSRI
jgi:hypothetical protein